MPHTPSIAFRHLPPRKEGCRKPVLGVRDCPFNGVTSCCSVWRKGAGKRGLECELEGDGVVVVGLTSMQKLRHKFQSAIVSIVSLQDNHRAVIPAIAPKPDNDVRFFFFFRSNLSSKSYDYNLRHDIKVLALNHNSIREYII